MKKKKQRRRSIAIEVSVVSAAVASAVTNEAHVGCTRQW
jgi:hypothetical protein